MLPTVATPRASELCCMVAVTPLPAPARWAGTSESRTPKMGLIRRPCPAPMMIMPGTSAHPLGWGHDALRPTASSIMPRASTSAPTTRTRRPKRASRRATEREAARKVSAIGRRMTPVRSGLNPAPS
jgi:hypothetical protein